MNLLESILHTSEATEYLDIFKKHEIDAFTLKILSGEDLRILGIDNEEKRQSIIEHAANLQVPAEKLKDIVIDEKYMQIVLSQMSVQLTRHLASLSIALNRKDIVICDIKLGGTARCLESSILSLEDQINKIELKVFNKKRKNRKHLIIPLAAVGLSTIIIVYRYCFKH